MLRARIWHSTRSTHLVETFILLNGKAEEGPAEAECYLSWFGINLKGDFVIFAWFRVGALPIETSGQFQQQGKVVWVIYLGFLVKLNCFIQVTAFIHFQVNISLKFCDFRWVEIWGLSNHIVKFLLSFFWLIVFTVEKLSKTEQSRWVLWLTLQTQGALLVAPVFPVFFGTLGRFGLWWWSIHFTHLGDPDWGRFSSRSFWFESNLQGRLIRSLIFYNINTWRNNWSQIAS